MKTIAVYHFMIIVFLQTDGFFCSFDANETSTGRAVSQGEFPYQVALVVNFNSEIPCGGAIVASNVVLTSATCLFYYWGGQMPPLVIDVKAGGTNLRENSIEVYNAKNVIIHPWFDKLKMVYNLALIEIHNTFSQNESLIGIASLKNHSRNATINMDDCVTIGWSEVSNDLRVWDLEKVNCSATSYRNDLCFQNKEMNQNACDAKLGSSLVCDNVLVGILSTKSDCNSTHQLLKFENISYSSDFLIENGISSCGSLVLSLSSVLALYLLTRFLI